ncbi:unnamed protein product [Adineta steineri]|uniref:PDZ domain-containing protein n=2 Tax=Adineta steineri TaxID=433720 RepID=A0A819C868_9BILA|nr:unnamed protein product [Adineta steineri]
MNFLFLGDILIFLNERNLLKSPIVLTNEHIKSEFAALRRHNKPIRIGICRCTDRSLLNNTTIKHLGSITFDEFQKLSIDNRSTPSLDESRKSLVIVDEIITNIDSKHVSNKHQTKPLIYKRSTSPARDSGFIETDGTNTSVLTDRSVNSNYIKRRSKVSLEKSEDDSTDTHKSLDSLQHSISKPLEEIKSKPSGLIYSIPISHKSRQIQRDLPTQTVTDACFIYRHQVVKQDANDDEKAAMILRGREIAYEAANTPTIPSSMPNYTHDQIRELYGELDKKTRRLQQDEYTLHTPMIHTYHDKPQWKLASPTKTKIIDECPLPKFRLEKPTENDEALLMAAYLSTGMNSPQTKPSVPVDNFYTVMMNASAKVNEWAHNNEIYLSPIEKDSSSLLLSNHMTIKQLTGSPTSNNDRPTFLGNMEQQTTNSSNQTFTNRQSRHSIRRQQQQTTDTISTSPDSSKIVAEVTPSTPGSCGMYLEPYMRHGYSLPSADHHVRDSSWQHDDIEESTVSIKNITPVDSSATRKFDIDMFPSPPMTSQIIDTDNSIDVDDGTTNSYHTAKESRGDNAHQSSLSIESDETITSTLQPLIVRDDLINNMASPEDSFYYDALASPSQINQHLPPPPPSSAEADRQHIHIDNLSEILQQIETFNHTNHRLLTRIDEDKARLPPEGEESKINIDQLVAIVEDIHRCNQTRNSHTMDNLLFIYDEIDDEQANPSINNLVEIVHALNQTPSCVDNLLFIYADDDDQITPSDDEPKHITHDSDEWSYDNLVGDSDDQVNTDHLGTIVHEALAARFQQAIKFKHEALEVNNTNDYEDSEPLADTDNLGTIIHEALAARFQKPIKVKTSNSPHYENLPQKLPKSVDDDDSMADTDNLGNIVHEALAARFQKPITINTADQIDSQDGFPEELPDPIDEPPIDNLGNIIYETLAARFQKPIKMKTPDSFNYDVFPEELPKFIDESPTANDNYGTIVQEALADRIQKPIYMESVDQSNSQVFSEESPENIDEQAGVIDNLETDFTDQVDSEAFPEESIADTDPNAFADRYQTPTTMKSSDRYNFDVYSEELPELTYDESLADTNNFDTHVYEHIASRYQEDNEMKSAFKFHNNFPTEESQEYIDESNDDIIEYEILQETNNEFISSNLENPADETRDEIIVYDILQDSSNEFMSSNFENPIDETIDETMVYEILQDSINKLMPLNLGNYTNESIGNTHTLETMIYEINPPMQSPNHNRPPVGNLSQIVSDSLLTSSNYHQFHQNQDKIEFTITHPPPPLYDEEIYEEYGYRRTTTDPQTDDIVEKFEELCHRYSTNYEQYQTTAKQIDNEINEFERQVHEQREQNVSPVSDTTSEELITTIERIIDKPNEVKSKIIDFDNVYSTIKVTRQEDYIGKYGFDLKETVDGKIKVSSIINGNYCPHLNIGDEIISINDTKTFQTYEQCQLLLHSLWKNTYDNVQITVLKSATIPTVSSK